MCKENKNYQLKILYPKNYSSKVKKKDFFRQRKTG